MHIRFIVVFISCLISSTIAFGSNTRGEIAFEKTAGVWINNSDYGYYQAHVFRSQKSGLIKDTVTISEISYRESSTKPRLSYTLPASSVKGLIGGITFRMIDGQRMLLYLDIETDIREVARIREVYMLSPGGKFKLLEKAQDMDNIPYK